MSWNEKKFPDSDLFTSSICYCNSRLQSESVKGFQESEVGDKQSIENKKVVPKKKQPHKRQGKDFDPLGR